MAKAVFLDIDGTLMDTIYLHIEARARALKVRDPVPRAVIHEQIGKGSDKLIPEFVRDEEVSERASELTRSSTARSRTARTPCRGRGS